MAPHSLGPLRAQKAVSSPGNRGRPRAQVEGCRGAPPVAPRENAGGLRSGGTPGRARQLSVRAGEPGPPPRPPRLPHPPPTLRPRPAQASPPSSAAGQCSARGGRAQLGRGRARTELRRRERRAGWEGGRRRGGLGESRARGRGGRHGRGAPRPPPRRLAGCRGSRLRRSAGPAQARARRRRKVRRGQAAAGFQELAAAPGAHRPPSSGSGALRPRGRAPSPPPRGP